jgi:hypothetical protein
MTCASAALQLKRLFRDVVILPRSTVKLSQSGEVLEVTCFRGISRAASLFSVASDAGEGLAAVRCYDWGVECYDVELLQRLQGVQRAWQHTSSAWLAM